MPRVNPEPVAVDHPLVILVTRRHLDGASATGWAAAKTEPEPFPSRPSDERWLLAHGTPSQTISETSNTTSDPDASVRERTSPSTAQTRSFSQR